MSLNSPKEEAERRQRVQREEAEKRKTEQRRAKCRVLNGLIIGQRNEMLILDGNREEARQEWQNVTNRRMKENDPSVIAELRSEQQRLRSIIDSLVWKIHLAKSRLQQLENDHTFNRCDAL